jgi:hypothetical protein
MRNPDMIPARNTTKMSNVVMFVTFMRLHHSSFQIAGTEAGCYQIWADTPVCPYKYCSPGERFSGIGSSARKTVDSGEILEVLGEGAGEALLSRRVSPDSFFSLALILSSP